MLLPIVVVPIYHKQCTSVPCDEKRISVVGKSHYFIYGGKNYLFKVVTFEHRNWRVFM